MNRQRGIEPKADSFLQEKLYLAIYHYIKNDNYQEYFNYFQGALDFIFRDNRIKVDKFIFLHNYLVWMENRELFDEDYDAWANEFHNLMLSDLADNI